MSVEVEGIRVVRGPNWHYGDDDGDEGHVGTVTQDNEDDTVEVQWDMGNSGTYDSGNDGKCDLRVLDSAQLGIHVPADGDIKERTTVACYLIQNGADVDIRNKRGRNTLECCNDERMRNAIRMFAAKHCGRPASAAKGRRQGGATVADLFAELPLPCMGCMGKMADAKFGPCGHKVCCRACAFRVRDCPMCDTPIAERRDLDGEPLDPVIPCRVQ